jgi:8-oxo-dGTP pyrophosphatase MutT (NUDIX family)
VSAGGEASLPDWMQRVAGAVPRLGAGDLGRGVPSRHTVREAAVLMLFGASPGAREPDGRVLLIERAASLRSHPGQVAFPGGKVDPHDASPEAAALREAHEETGLEPEDVRVLARLPRLHVPPSGFAVTPVLAWWQRPGPVGVRDPAEVARVVPVDLADLLDPRNRFTVVHPSGVVGPGFASGGLFVWGFTAGLLSRLLAAAGLEVPWDADRHEPLPPAQLVPPVATEDEQVLP